MSATNTYIASCCCNDTNRVGIGSYRVSLGRAQPVQVCSLRSIVMRNVFYNVVSEGPRKNNTFHFNLGGVDYATELTQGFWDITTLLAQLQQQIESILSGSGIIPLPTLNAFNYNSLDAKITIVINGNGVATPFTLQGGTYRQSINDLLGNTEDIDLNTLTPAPYTFDSIINLGGVDAIYIKSQTIAPTTGIASRRNKEGANMALVKVVANDAVFGGLIRYETPDIDAEAFVYDTSGMSPSNIDFTFEDREGRELDMSNSEVILEFQMWKKLER